MTGAIVLAFDDAYLSTSLAFGVLSDAEIVASVPIATGTVGGVLAGNTVLGWDALDDMVDAGWEVTNHSVTHTALDTLTETQIEDEIEGGRDALAARGYPGDGRLHFVAPNHATNSTVRAVAERVGMKSNRDTSTSSAPVVIPPDRSRRYSLRSQLFNSADVAATTSMLTAAMTDGQIAFVHTHGGDTEKWGQVRDHIVANGWEGDCLTMTQLWRRIDWLWARPQPLINARSYTDRVAVGLPS